MNNVVVLVGRLGAAPEIRKVNSSKGETEVARLSVATWVNTFNQQTNEYDTKTEWHNVVAWGQQCKSLALAEKGDMVSVEGSIQYRSYETDSGEKRYTTEIVGRVRRHPKPRTAEQAPPAEQPVVHEARPIQQAEHPSNNPQDDLPF